MVKVDNLEISFLPIDGSISTTSSSYLSEWFVAFHLIGNSVSTIRSPLLKIASCQNRAVRYAKEISRDVV